MNDSRIHDREKMLLETTKHIGTIIRDLRILKGYDVSDLAFYARMSEKSIYNIEMGDGNVTLKSLINISDALGVTILSLMA